MAAGVFGVIGYDMVRLVERLPDVPADPLDLPDSIMIRPSVVAIFDAIAQEIILVTTVRPSEIDAAGGLRRGRRRASRRRRRRPRASPLAAKPRRSPRPDGALTGAAQPHRRQPRAYGEIVERAKRYIEAGDIFQVVPSHRFTAPYPGSAVRALPLAAPDQPLALPVLSQLSRLPAGRLVAGDPGPPARQQDHHPPHRRHPPPRRDAGGGRSPSRSNSWPTKRSAPST